MARVMDRYIVRLRRLVSHATLPRTGRVIARAAGGAAFVAVLLMAYAAPSAAQAPAGNGQYADVNGIRLYYEVHGEGRPLVLLHGGLSATEAWGANLHALAQGRQVIAVDLQGHGRTADIDRPLDPRLMADDIAALIAHLGHARADVVGYSLGGGVAIHTAIRHPAAVDRVVAISAIIRRDAYYPEILEQQTYVNAAMADAMKETPMYELYSAIAPRPEDWPRLLDKIGELMAHDFDLSAEFASIRAPMLIVAADADLFPPSHAVEMFGLLGGGKQDGGWDGSGRPAAQLAILPGLTHYNIFSDPSLVPVVVRFLDESAVAAR